MSAEEVSALLSSCLASVLPAGGGPLPRILALRDPASGTLVPLRLALEQLARGDTWGDVEKHTAELDFRVSTHFQPLDVRDSDTWSTQSKYRKSQLFTFVYFLSEVYRFEEEAQPFFEALVNNATKGAYFLFIDNDTETFRGQIQRFSDEYGLRVIKAASIDHRTDTTEEKRDLNPYYTDLRHDPKLGGKIYRALMVKR